MLRSEVAPVRPDTAAVLLSFGVSLLGNAQPFLLKSWGFLGFVYLLIFGLPLRSCSLSVSCLCKASR